MYSRFTASTAGETVTLLGRNGAGAGAGALGFSSMDVISGAEP